MFFYCMYQKQMTIQKFQWNSVKKSANFSMSPLKAKKHIYVSLHCVCDYGSDFGTYRWINSILHKKAIKRCLLIRFEFKAFHTKLGICESPTTSVNCIAHKILCVRNFWHLFDKCCEFRFDLLIDIVSRIFRWIKILTKTKNNDCARFVIELI